VAALLGGCGAARRGAGGCSGGTLPVHSRDDGAEQLLPHRVCIVVPAAAAAARSPIW
jgi:hypothetical protein